MFREFGGLQVVYVYKYLNIILKIKKGRNALKYMKVELKINI